MAKKKPKSFDFSDDDAIRAVMARELDVDPDEIEIEESTLASFNVGDAKSISLGGNKEWTVVPDDDTAEKIALAVVNQDLESEPEIFNRDFIKSHIDQEKLKKWVYDAAMEDDYAADIASDDAERFWKEAEQWFDLDELRQKEADKISKDVSEVFRRAYEAHPDKGMDDALALQSARQDASDEVPRGVTGDFDDEALTFTADVDDDIPLPDDVPRKYIDQLREAIAEDKAKNPMAFFEDIYGRDEAAKHAIDAVGIDIDAAAKEAVHVDGWQHFLARYDGESYETKEGLVWWRDN